MKLRYKILYMSFGAGLVVLGMVLNSLTGRYANAQEESVNVETNEQKGSENVTFKNITCESIVSKTGFWILVHGVCAERTQYLYGNRR